MTGLQPVTADECVPQESAPDAGPRSARRWIWLGALAVFCAIGGYWWNRPGGRDAQDGGLAVAAEALDFGEVRVDRAFHWTVPIQNTTARDIRIVEFKTSCPCSDVKPPSLVVRAGRTERLDITLNLTPSRIDDATVAVRPFEVRLAPVFREPTPKVAWTLRGRVRQPYYVSPKAVGFGGANAVVSGVRALTCTF